MCSQFLTILTCLAILWHSIGGCCWHHEHSDCDAEVPLSASVEMHHPPGRHSHCHLNHKHHDADQDEPLSPTPCDHGDHCSGEICVYVKSMTPNVTDLFHSQAEFVTPVADPLAVQASATLRTTDRVVLPQAELSAQHHCALTQSWLL